MTKVYTIELSEGNVHLEGKSHAAIFRNFWAHFLTTDLEKTIETIELVGIRTSEDEFFVAKNGSKKKNIFVKENYWIYTHLTPIAMLKAYEKFVAGWEGEYEAPEPKVKKKKTPPVAKPVEPVQPEPELEPLAEEPESEPLLTIQEQIDEIDAIDRTGMKPTEKTKLTKLRNKLVKQLAENEVEEIDL